MVTAGALQSVHRLAEGMIAAAAAAAARRHERNNHNPRETSESEAAAGEAAATAVGRDRVPGVVGAGIGQQTAGGGAAGEVGNNDDGQQPTRRANDNSTPGVDRASCILAGPHYVAKVEGGDAESCSLVEHLVARTTKEYVEKAVAVATPGALKESVRRVLCRGRDGMLHGDGDSVAMDWERFLKSAATSALSV